MTTRELRRPLLYSVNGIDDRPTDSDPPSPPGSPPEPNRRKPPLKKRLFGRKPKQVGLQGSCECGNGVIFQFRQYLYGNELQGVQCKKCEKEYLPRRSTSEDPQIKIDGVDLCHYPVTLETDDAAHQVKASRKRLEKASAGKEIGPGDHISWHRPKGIWHHAIVVETFNENKVKVIHFGKQQDGVYESTINLNDEAGDMYLMVYSDKEIEFNPPKLVIARAKSMVKEKGYKLLANNCEHFATFCKVGLKRSQQISWLKRKLKQFLGCQAATDILKVTASSAVIAILKQVFEISTAEVIEMVAKGSNWIGVAIVVLWEVGTFAYDVKQIHKSYKDGKLTKIEFKRSVAQRTVEGILKGGFMIGGSLLGGFIGGFAGPAGIVGVSILGGFLGGFLGTAIALRLAPVIARRLFPGRADE